MIKSSQRYSIFIHTTDCICVVQKCFGFKKNIPWLNHVSKLACHPKSICYAITIILWLLWIWSKSSSFFIHADGRNFRVRRGFAQIWCSDPFEAMVISGLRCNFGPVPPFLVFRFPFSVPCSSFLHLPCPFSVLCWSNILLLLWYNSG